MSKSGCSRACATRSHASPLPPEIDQQEDEAQAADNDDGLIFLWWLHEPTYVVVPAALRNLCELESFLLTSRDESRLYESYYLPARVSRWFFDAGQNLVSIRNIVFLKETHMKGEKKQI